MTFSPPSLSPTPPSGSPHPTGAGSPDGSAYQSLLETVGMIRRSWQIRRALEGLLLTLAIGLAALTLALCLDVPFHLAQSLRFLAALLVYGSTFAALYQWVWRPWQARHPDDYFAALAEQRQPSLRNRFINALQLGRESQPPAPHLVAAIVAQGAAGVDDLDPSAIVRQPALRRYGMILLGVAALAVLVAQLAGPAAPVSAARILLPWADIAPFTWTGLLVQPDQSLHLLQGQPLEIQAKTTGQAPAQVTLTWADAQRQPRLVAMIQPDSEQFRYLHTFPVVESSFEFFVTAGDSRSRLTQVLVDPRPRIDAMSVTYTLPPYAAQPPRTVEKFDGHLRAIPHSTAQLSLKANKPLRSLTLVPSTGEPVSCQPTADAMRWTATLELTAAGTYQFELADTQGYQVTDPAIYTITLEPDASPTIALAKPGRDMQVKPQETVDFLIVAQDDFGLGQVQLLGRINPRSESDDDAKVLQNWPGDLSPPAKRAELPFSTAPEKLGMKSGDRLQYWAVALDRNDLSPTGPGRAQTRRFNLLALTADQSRALLDQQLADYVKMVQELIRLQRLNRAQAAELKAALALVDRQALIRRYTLTLAQAMEQHAFAGRSIIDELRTLAGGPMLRVLGLLESYRDATELDQGKKPAADSLPVQDQIIASLEAILTRLSRAELVRSDLKKLAQMDPQKEKAAAAVLGKLGEDLAKFLKEMKEVGEPHEKMPKRPGEDLKTSDLDNLASIDQRLDRWKKWAKDSVDAISKLPQNLATDTHLAENVSTIFEEIEKKERKPTVEIATPLEEGGKWVGTEVLEDLEMWQMDRGDNLKWVMEEPLEGNFKVPEATLPEKLQDLVGDLIEDMDEFDQEADDVTSAWGGNMPQSGWAIADGPMSTFGATGKTGNQLPNNSELTGRSGAGRRGKATGQMVGDESTAMEGRPTPARVTNEKYEAGQPKANKQLDPRGSTGGGKKTGGGARGLQGGTPPDMVKDMARLTDKQALLREKMTQVANQISLGGRPATHVNRALELMKSAEDDLRDLRYEDAARKRRLALSELRSSTSEVDRAVDLSLQRAAELPPELRKAVSAGAQQAMPQGYEEMVGQYYKAISGAGNK